MSIIKCPECGKEYSDTASKCIHCGYRKELSKNVKRNITIALLLQIAAIVLLVVCSYIYIFDGYYTNYHYSPFGNEFDYSANRLERNDSYGNLFLNQTNTSENKADVSAIIVLVSYIVIILGVCGIVSHLYILLSKKPFPYSLYLPILTAGTLIIHSLVVSLSRPDMIGSDGYYEIRPSIVWFLIMILEIVATILNQKVQNRTVKAEEKETMTGVNVTPSGFVDMHGIFHNSESNASKKDLDD